MPPFPETTGSLPAFASTKREILLILKREGDVDLQTLSERLGVTKMAIHRHAKELEAHGLIERYPVRSGLGRPRLALRLASGATDLFPKAYAGVTCAALSFIEEKLGRKGVEEALRRRQTDLLPSYRERVASEDLGERVASMATLRDQEGYMAEARSAGKGQFEILEHNCPILAIAQDYQEACMVEQEMFRKVLDADVEATHRVVAGAHVCRFLVKPKKERAA